MEFIYQILVITYVIVLAYIMVFCLMQFQLLFSYRRYHRKNRNAVEGESLTGTSELPQVTIQLPLYNELYVSDRLIDKVCKFDYPKDKLEIQILDDSTDETIELVARKVEKYKSKGFDIHHFRRDVRDGFKAGALRDGLKVAKGEFIAIFDADFLPNEDFLKTTIPHFEDRKIGVVQTRWDHINEDYSLITKLQAFQLNVHFRVEQTGRYASNYLLQFNGTAGIWRRRTIDEAGGWEADTLTEDLDLSYRAQLKGWKIKYLEEVGSPAELPAEMNSLKSQQFRWMKGGAETARKMLPTIWRSGITPLQKLHATGHLLSSAIFLFVFIAGVLSVPTLMAVHTLEMKPTFLQIFLISILSIGSVYYVANFRPSLTQKGSIWHRLAKFALLFPLFLALSMGLSLHNSIAVLQGYIGKKSAFIRTPKFNILNLNDTVESNQYLPKKLSLSTIGEGIMAIYFILAIFYGLYSGITTFILYHFLLALGFGTICYFSIKHLSLK